MTTTSFRTLKRRVSSEEVQERKMVGAWRWIGYVKPCDENC